MTHSKKVLSDAFKSWIPLGAAIVLLSGLLYVAVQQNYRLSANDPQTQIAEDIATAIQQGTPADSIVPATGTTDIANSLSAFVLIYDDTGKQIGSSAILDGKNPEYPTNVFNNVKQKGGEEAVTWQPRSGVRMATVVTSYPATASGTSPGFIVAGRSLREVEKRINNLGLMVFVGMIFTLLVTFLLKWLGKNMMHEHGEGKHEHMEITLDTDKA
jgi:hypothetical protein